jgi:hypothetical protein
VGVLRLALMVSCVKNTIISGFLKTQGWPPMRSPNGSAANGTPTTSNSCIGPQRGSCVLQCIGVSSYFDWFSILSLFPPFVSAGVRVQGCSPCRNIDFDEMVMLQMCWRGSRLIATSQDSRMERRVARKRSRQPSDMESKRDARLPALSILRRSPAVGGRRLRVVSCHLQRSAPLSR